MESERNMLSVKNNIIKNSLLSNENLLAMIDAYTYGTATPMQGLINVLKMIKEKIVTGNTVYYYEEQNKLCLSSIEDYEIFVLNFFDELVLNKTED